MIHADDVLKHLLGAIRRLDDEERANLASLLLRLVPRIKRGGGKQPHASDPSERATTTEDASR